MNGRRVILAILSFLHTFTKYAANEEDREFAKRMKADIETRYPLK